MFVQHQITKHSLLERVALPSDDFELYIHEKTQQKIKGNIQFIYLNETFSAKILITPQTIQIQAEQDFQGIKLNAPVLSSNEISRTNYLLNGTLTKLGHQNIVWLILDFIHLYNLLRLKPGTVLELYRVAFGFAKSFDTAIVFGKIDINSPIAKLAAKVLTQKWKRRHKYEFGNQLDLLASIQALLANYPHQFTPTTISNLEQKAIIIDKSL
jgi:hypothetical protein